jgi:hypothetical protein
MIEILKTKKSDDMLTYINNNRNYFTLGGVQEEINRQLRNIL